MQITEYSVRFTCYAKYYLTMDKQIQTKVLDHPGFDLSVDLIGKDKKKIVV